MKRPNDLTEQLLTPTPLRNGKINTAFQDSDVHDNYDDNTGSYMEESCVHDRAFSWREDVFRSGEQWMAMISNFSTSYNVVNISMVLPILESMVASSSSPLMKNEDSESSSLCASSLLGGMIVGQLLGGWLGDVLGRFNALSVVMFVQLFASLGSSIFVPSYEIMDDNKLDEILTVLAVWRFVLGMGAGGVYPLAALLSEESSVKLNKHNKTKIMSFVFATQGVAFCIVPSLTLLLLQTICSSAHTSNKNNAKLNIVWRLLLGFGALPSVPLIFILLHKRFTRRKQNNNHSGEDLHESNDDNDRHFLLLEIEEENTPDPLSIPNEGEETSTNPTAKRLGLWQSIRNEPHIVKKLFGTAFTWFLFDLLFYGNTLFQPIVLDAAFGNKATENTTPLHTLKTTAFRSIILNLIAMPGYVVSFLIMGKPCLCWTNIIQTPKWIQTQGFICMGVLYTVIASCWNGFRSSKGNAFWLLVLYGGTFFFANYGPNTTTFIMPSLVYSPSCGCRSTLNGFCAAAGKFGALLGATFFAPISDAYGDKFVMSICAAISMIAAVLTTLCVPRAEPVHPTT